MRANLSLAVDGIGEVLSIPQTQELLESLDLVSLVPGRSQAAPDPRELRRLLPSVRFRAVRNVYCGRAGSSVRGLGLASRHPADREMALGQTIATASQARDLAAPWVIVELGPPPFWQANPEGGHLLAPDEPEQWSRQAAEFQRNLADCRDDCLDMLSRSLHAVASAVPEVRLAVALAAEPFELPTVDMVEALIEDLGPRRVGYWHDTGRAHALALRGREPAEEWLSRLGPSCVGVDLSDAVGTTVGLPPGSGEVDFATLRDGLASGIKRCVRVEPFPLAGPLAAALQYLDQVGL